MALLKKDSGESQNETGYYFHIAVRAKYVLFHYPKCVKSSNALAPDQIYPAAGKGVRRIYGRWGGRHIFS